MEPLDETLDTITHHLEGLNTAREETLKRTRRIIRVCANTIRATHRREWAKAEEGLQQAREIVENLMGGVEDYPELYHSGYTHDALREYVEAHLTHALIRGWALPTLDDLRVDPAAYLNGLAEAATELRRQILDILRHDHDTEAERLLEAMDAIYSQLMTIDYPDAIVKGLRRRTDILRSVLDRTRGDITTSLRQQRLESALEALEKRLAIDGINAE